MERPFSGFRAELLVWMEEQLEAGRSCSCRNPWGQLAPALLWERSCTSASVPCQVAAVASSQGVQRVQPSSTPCSVLVPPGAPWGGAGWFCAGIWLCACLGRSGGERSLPRAPCSALLDLSDSRAGVCSATFFILLNRCLWAASNQTQNEMQKTGRLQMRDG